MTSRIDHTRVELRALPVMADIGINAHEIGRRQPLIVSVVLDVAPVLRDAIEATVDYRRIARFAEELGEQRIALIETFARRMAEQCLAMPGVQAAAITIDKPHALPAGIASVTLQLQRDDAKTLDAVAAQDVIEEEV